MNEVAKQEAAPTTVIEINGVKLEVDLRSARRIDTLRVGDRVKLLEKTSYGGPIVHHGVVAGFDPFPSQPTIIVSEDLHRFTGVSRNGKAAISAEAT